MLSITDPTTERGRLCAAVLSFVGENGYDQLSPDALERERGIEPATVARHFQDLDSCLLAIWVAIDEEVCGLTGDAFAAAPSWRSGIRAALVAALGHFAVEPAAARVYLVESVFLGERLLDRRWRTIGDLAAMIAQTPQRLEVLTGATTTISEALAGGVWRLVQRLVLEGRTAELPELAPELTYFCVLPFYGRTEAETELDDR